MEGTSVGRSSKGFVLKENEDIKQWQDGGMDKGKFYFVLILFTLLL